jgi:hypothetical protein
MLVPSLSWLNLGHFYAQIVPPKKVLSAYRPWPFRASDPGRICAPRARGESLRRGKTHLFLSFPCVCPEPVLVNCSFVYINGSKRDRFDSPGSGSTTAASDGTFTRSECRAGGTATAVSGTMVSLASLGACPKSSPGAAAGGTADQPVFGGSFGPPLTSGLARLAGFGCKACTKRLLLQLFLCLSRACLGKSIVFTP